MLHVDRPRVGHFNHLEVGEIFLERGWKALLPNALSDSQLLRTAQDLRSLLSSDSWEPNSHGEAPAIAMTRLLLEGCRAEGDATGGSAFEVSTLQEGMTMLSLTVDREIVSRLLGMGSDDGDEALTVLLGLIASQRTEQIQMSNPPGHG